MKSLITTQLQWFALSLLFFSSVQSQAICDFSDSECLTRGANQAHKMLTAGAEGKAEPSDPLQYEMLEGSIGELTFKLNDITLTGLGSCEVTLLACNQKESKFEYNLRCPKLILKSKFDIKGPLATLALDGRGDLAITAEDYVIKYNGKYSGLDAADKMPRISLEQYSVETEAIGNVIFESDDMITGDKEKSALALKFFNENWKEIEKIFKKSTINVVLVKALKNINDALKTYPMEKLVPKQ